MYIDWKAEKMMRDVVPCAVEKKILKVFFLIPIRQKEGDEQIKSVRKITILSWIELRNTFKNLNYIFDSRGDVYGGY